MEKEIPTNPNNNYNVPTLGPGTSTSSGVTVFAGSIPNNNTNPPPPPPTYDQAVGNSTANVGPKPTYTATGGCAAPNMPYTIPQSHTTTTTYTTYTTRGPPPPTQQQPTAYAQPPVVIIQQQPMIPLGPEPVYITCPACHIQKLTRIEHEPSPKTHLMAALLCLVGLWCCVCVPYCAGSCMNTHHYCGNCGKFLGTYGNTL